MPFVVVFVGRFLWVLCHVQGPITGQEMRQAVYESAFACWLLLVVVLLAGTGGCS